MNDFCKIYIAKNINLPIDSSGDAGAVTIPSFESDLNMVISLGHYMQG
jgi:hypothetical protein